MPIFREGKVRAPCDRCGRAFDPVDGGVCSECRKLLCADHLYGSFGRRMLALLGAKPVCVHCRGRRGARG